MRPRHDFDYVQARLSARHGQHLSETDWRTLRANRSLGLFLDQARSTPLNRWTDQLHVNMKPHTMERLLRASWRAYVKEVANWPPPKWCDCILWLSPLPDLMIIEHLLHGGAAPSWLRRDTYLAGFTLIDAEARDRAIAKAGLFPLAHTKDQTSSIRQRWSRHFAMLWPLDEQAELVSLVKLFGAFTFGIDERRKNGGMESSLATIERTLISIFRRNAMTSIALFAHLGLVFIDLIRLRGELLERLLFQEIAAGASS